MGARSSKCSKYDVVHAEIVEDQHAVLDSIAMRRQEDSAYLLCSRSADDWRRYFMTHDRTIPSDAARKAGDVLACRGLHPMDGQVSSLLLLARDPDDVATVLRHAGVDERCALAAADWQASGRRMYADDARRAAAEASRLKRSNTVACHLSANISADASGVEGGGIRLRRGGSVRAA